MKGSKYIAAVFIGFVFTCILFVSTSSAEDDSENNETDIPSHVLLISKENTFPNATEDQEVVEASELTKELLEEVDIAVENPDLIKLLNETSINPSPISFGYRGMVYLGRWPLHYQSEESNVNWEYQQINENELNNIGGDSTQQLNYIQLEEKEIKGAITSKIANPDDVKKMMLVKAKENVKLPLSYQTIIGKNTKKDNSYEVPANKYGSLRTFAPAVNEKGQVTFGEVYLELKGTKKTITIKNITKQGIGAWIPVQDHLSFSYQLK